MLTNVQTYVQDADYNGKTLIGDLTGSTGSFGRVAVARNESGSSYGVASFSGSAMYGSISFTSTQLAGASTVAALITTTGTFLNSAGVGWHRTELGRQLDQLRQQPDHLQQRQDRFAEQWTWIADRCRSGERVSPAHGVANPPAAWHPGAFAGEPGTADTAEPVQVIVFRWPADPISGPRGLPVENRFAPRKGSNV